MTKKLNKKIIRKMNEIGIDLNILGSLARILNESIRESSNLKYFDTENLSSVLKQKINTINYKYGSIIKILNI
jgi:hypothetical protein